MENLPAMLDVWQKSLGWQPSQGQLALYDQLFQAILTGNKKQNLTRITEVQEFWEKHLWDSLLGIMPFMKGDFKVANLTDQDSRSGALNIIDIGTGAGFPGMPIAIANEGWSVTMVDSTRKKVTFIREAIAELQLKNAKAIVSRAESLGREDSHREKYDLALIRAVGQPNVCAEYVLPLVKVGGFAVLYRGHWEETDNKALSKAAHLLSSEVIQIQTSMTPLSESVRNCVYLRKKSPISHRYPRGVGIPNQNPLALKK